MGGREKERMISVATVVSGGAIITISLIDLFQNPHQWLHAEFSFFLIRVYLVVMGLMLAIASLMKSDLMYQCATPRPFLGSLAVNHGDTNMHRHSDHATPPPA